MDVGATPPIQASSVNTEGGGVRATKLAQDQLKAEGQAAVQLIEAAASTGTAPTGSAQGVSGANIDVRV